MAYTFRYNEEKNQLLIATRKISFEDIIFAIKKGQLLTDLIHHSRGNQKIYVVKIQNYAYAVPYVMDIKKQEIFLKTIYPSRELTKRYITNKNYE